MQKVYLKAPQKTDHKLRHLTHVKKKKSFMKYPYDSAAPSQVVPPGQVRGMYELVRSKGLPAAFVVLEGELYPFFCSVFSFFVSCVVSCARTHFQS